MIEICFIISVILSFLSGRIGDYLDKQLENNNVPPNGKLVYFIIKNSLWSFAYRFVISSDSYKTKVPRNENEEKIIKLIISLYRISLTAILLALVISICLILKNNN